MAQCVTVRRAQKDGTSSSYCLTMTQSVIFNIKVYCHHENFAHTSTYFFFILTVKILIFFYLDKLRQNMTEKLRNFKTVGQSYGNLYGCCMEGGKGICMRKIPMYLMMSQPKTQFTGK